MLFPVTDNDADPKSVGQPQSVPELQQQMSIGPGSIPQPASVGAPTNMDGGAPAQPPPQRQPPPAMQPPTAVEGPFMQQQQSQILVFSTVMANKAAESVRSGQCASFRDFHLNHPIVQNFLQVRSRTLPPVSLLRKFQGNRMTTSSALITFQKKNSLALLCDAYRAVASRLHIAAVCARH